MAGKITGTIKSLRLPARLIGTRDGLTVIDRIRMRFNPFLITTVDGLRDRRKLQRRDGLIENENERTTFVEYWDGPRLVHRSAHVRLKQMPHFIQTSTGGLQ